MPNVFLEGLQRPAILQNNSGLPDYSEANDGDALIIEDGEPTWGAVDALPEIEESDEGKFLSVDQGEAVWADAPSGLPEITNSDEGKILTVVAEQQQTKVYYVPEQTITLTNGAGTATGADFSGLSENDTAILSLTVGDKTTTTEGTLYGTALAFGRASDISSNGAVNLSAQDVGFNVLELSGEHTATLSVYQLVSGETVYKADWEDIESEPEIVIVRITGESYNSNDDVYEGTASMSATDIKTALLAGKLVYLLSTVAFNDKLVLIPLNGVGSTDAYFGDLILNGGYSGSALSLVAMSATVTGTSVTIYSTWYSVTAST